MLNRRRCRSLSARAGVAALLVIGGSAAAAAPASAGTATATAPNVQFTDPGGSDDDLEVKLVPVQPDDGLPAGWVVGLYSRAGVAAGAGCTQGATSVWCPSGPALPVPAIDLGAGNDQLSLAAHAAAAGSRAKVLGGPGDDQVETRSIVATIDAGPGDDVIRPWWTVLLDFPTADRTPGDVLIGGPGTDTVDYDGLLGPVRVSLDGVADDGPPGERDDVRADVENVIAPEFSSVLVGSDVANALTGGNGDDRIAGGRGRDRLTGNSGNDVIDALDAAGGDRVVCGDGADTAHVDAGDVVASDCERVVWAPATASSRLHYRRGAIPVTLRCPRDSASRCVGTLRLTDARGRTLASGRYAIKRATARAVALRPRRTPPRRAVLTVAPRGTKPIAGRATTIR